MSFKTLSKISTFLFAFSVSAEAPFNIAPILLDEILEAKVYRGFHGKTERLPQDAKCATGRRYWSFDWRSQFEDVNVDYNPSKPNFTSVEIILKDSSLMAQYFSQDNSKCAWSGAEGYIALGRITVKFDLIAQPNQDFPDIELQKLHFKDLDIRNVNITYRDTLQFKSQKFPKFFTKYIENNVNSFIWMFLKTDLKKKVDKAIQKEVSRRLKEREDSSPLIPIP